MLLNIAGFVFDHPRLPHMVAVDLHAIAVVLGVDSVESVVVNLTQRKVKKNGRGNSGIGASTWWQRCEEVLVRGVAKNQNCPPLLQKYLQGVGELERRHGGDIYTSVARLTNACPHVGGEDCRLNPNIKAKCNEQHQAHSSTYRAAYLVVAPNHVALHSVAVWTRCDTPEHRSARVKHRHREYRSNYHCTEGHENDTEGFRG